MRQAPAGPLPDVSAPDPAASGRLVSFMDRRPAIPLAVLLGAAAIALIAWSFVVPIFETPDEPHHWQYARYLHDHAGLPVYGPDFVEANSPPLYYALVAPVASHTELPPPVVNATESGQLELPFAPRFYENTADAIWHYWPLRAARLLTVAMSVLTVFLCYLAGAEASGRRSSGLLCAGLVAFLPQFTFRGMSLSNDALVTTMAAAAAYMMVRLVRRGFTWRAGVLCGAFVALAYLSKISAICLTAPLALAVFTANAEWRRRIVHLGVMGVPAVMVAPWSVRNVSLYGDPFASGAMHAAVAHIVEEKPLTSEYFTTTFPHYLTRSFVGMFGWMNIPLPESIYAGFWVLGAAALCGLLWSCARREAPARIVIVMAAIVVLNLAVVVHINRTFSQPQGRYLFPSLPALAILITLGLEGLPGWSKYRNVMGTLAVVVLAALNAWILVSVVVPAYYPPVAPFVSRAVAALGPPRLHGLNTTTDGSLRITNGDPQLVIDSHLPADEFGFLQLEVEGTAAEPDEIGSVFFAVNGQSLTESQRVDFAWRADGKKRIVKLALLKHPRWKGTITVIRIDPINLAVERNMATVIRLGQVQARGTF